MRHELHLLTIQQVGATAGMSADLVDSPAKMQLNRSGVLELSEEAMIRSPNIF